LVLTFLRGRFDLDKLQAAWDAQGYKPIELEGTIAAASVSEDMSIDLESELGRIAFAKFNNVAVLEDGTLVYAPTLDALKSIVATSRGEQPSIADRVDVSALLAAQTEPLASAAIVGGSIFQYAPNIADPDFSGDDLKTQVAEASALPPVTLGLVGITAGGDGSSTGTPEADANAGRVEISALFATEGDAQTAAGVVTTRLDGGAATATGQPFNELFADWTANPVPGSPVLNIELTLAPEVPRQVWISILYRMDYTFLAW
jgi:hypothetical protein